MSWLNYYRLLKRHDGDLSKATEDELTSARRSNPNDHITALRLAKRQYQYDLDKERSARETRLEEAVLLLNSMVESGESHTAQSKGVVRAALHSQL